MQKKNSPLLKRGWKIQSEPFYADVSEDAIQKCEAVFFPVFRLSEKGQDDHQEFVVGGSAATETSSGFLRAKLGATSITCFTNCRWGIWLGLKKFFSQSIFFSFNPCVILEKYQHYFFLL